MSGLEFLMHGSYNFATVTASTFAHLISTNDSQTQDWHADFATDDWPHCKKKSNYFRLK
jgi:hypothetical protein